MASDSDVRKPTVMFAVTKKGVDLGDYSVFRDTIDEAKTDAEDISRRNNCATVVWEVKEVAECNPVATPVTWTEL